MPPTYLVQIVCAHNTAASKKSIYMNLKKMYAYKRQKSHSKDLHGRRCRHSWLVILVRKLNRGPGKWALWLDTSCVWQKLHPQKPWWNNRERMWHLSLDGSRVSRIPVTLGGRKTCLILRHGGRERLRRQQWLERRKGTDGVNRGVGKSTLGRG